MHHRSSIHFAAALLLAASAAPASAGDEGPFVRSLRLLQSQGTLDAVSPRNDQALKGKLAKALGKKGVLTAEGLQGLMDASRFDDLAGADGKIDADEVRAALDAATPSSRKRLVPKVVAHADYLATSFDLIDEPHRKAGEKLAGWIVENYKPGEPLHVTVVCTGNSRRSILGSTMGNIAAAYYGMPEVRFHSGGTAPSAFNSRTAACLREIGVEIEPTGAEAARGDAGTANPIYKVRWGDSDMEAIEFSKTYLDPANPQQAFAALMVCGEADAACPVVKGASLRISMPYLDPKIYDGGSYETLKYAERRDDVGRLLLSVMMQARNRLDQPSNR